MPQWIMIHLKPIWTKFTVIMGVTTVFFCLLFSTPIVAHAQSAIGANDTVSQGVQVIEQPLGLASTDIRVLIARVIKIALGLLGIIFVLLVIYGGFLYMTAGGNEEQIASAKKVLMNATIGLIIILSAYSIVLMVSRLLGLDGTSSNGEGGLGGISDGTGQSFYGSGGLGTIIKDHYPARNQVDVPRNAKIIITFKKPITVSTIIENTNANKDASGNDILGDCIVSATMLWEKDCDTLKKGSTLVTIKDAVTGQEIRGASVLASVDNGTVSTIVIRPFDTLGTDKDKVQYTVRLGAGITWNDPINNNPSIFSGRSSAFYDWTFKTDTTLDTTAPFVKNTFPDPASVETKNTVIQLEFSEAMDPTGLQGNFKLNGDYYELNGSTVFLKTENSSLPIGTMRLSNGYQTLEFTPEKECGQNACGGKIYCLPVCDKPGATCKIDTYKLLIKAGQTFPGNPKSFEAIPFSGAMDLAGNALDGNKNGAVDAVASTGEVFVEQAKPDNFLLVFSINDKIDLTAPYIKQVTPGPDAENVATDATTTILFSKRMRVESMYTIGLDEYPVSAEGTCVVPRITFNSDETTLTRLDHCPFVDQDGKRYFPSVDSRVEDVNFNCFFPGKGPIDNDRDSNASYICDDDNLTRCCPVTKDSVRSFCCNGFTDKSSKETCINALSVN